MCNKMWPTGGGGGDADLRPHPRPQRFFQLFSLRTEITTSTSRTVSISRTLSISRLHCYSRPFARVEGSLRTEVLYWRFLDDWKDCFPWRSELHVTVSLFSDASTRAWGAVLFRDGQKLVSRDYWPSDPSTDVNLLESRALLNALVSFKGHLSNSILMSILITKFLSLH